MHETTSSTADSLIYARVSTDEQSKKGFSIPSQIAECQRYAAQHAFSIAAVLSDDETGAIIERDDLARLRDMVRSGAIRRVIVWRQDRLARDELTYFTLRREFRLHDVELHAVTRGGKVDGLYASLEAVLDADERQRIADRTNKGRLDKAKRGKIIGAGPPPYGYIRQGDGESIVWVVDDEAAAIVVLIFHLYVDEQLSHAEIALRLTAQQIPTPSDRRPEIKRKRGPATWNRETVRWILRNPTYTGVFYAYRTKQPKGEQPKRRPPPRLRPASEWIPIAVPQIVDQALFDAAQRRLASAQQLAFRNSKREYLVARRIRCACTRAATATTSSLSGYNRKSYPYYSCNSRRLSKADKASAAPCDVPPFRADAVDRLVWAWVHDDLLDRERLRAGIAAYDARKARETQTDPSAADRERRDQLVDQRDRLNRAYLAKAMSFDEYQPLKKELDDQISAIERRLLDSAPQVARPSRAAAFLLVESLLDEYRDILDAAPFPLKRFIVDRLEISATLRLVDGEKRLLLRSDALDLEAERALS